MEIASRAGIPLGQRPSTAALQACSRLAGRIPEGVRRNVLAVLHHIAQRPGLPGPLLQPAASAAASLLINGEEEGLISSSLTVLESVAELLPGSSRPAEEVVRQGLLRAFARSVEGGAERQSLTERVEMCCDCLLFRSSMLHGYSQAARGATTQSVQASVLSEIKEAVLEGWPKIASWWLERYSSACEKSSITLERGHEQTLADSLLQFLREAHRARSDNSDADGGASVIAATESIVSLGLSSLDILPRVLADLIERNSQLPLNDRTCACATAILRRNLKSVQACFDDVWRVVASAPSNARRGFLVAMIGAYAETRQLPAVTSKLLRPLANSDFAPDVAEDVADGCVLAEMRSACANAVAGQVAPLIDETREGLKRLDVSGKPDDVELLAVEFASAIIDSIPVSDSQRRAISESTRLLIEDVVSPFVKASGSRRGNNKKSGRKRMAIRASTALKLFQSASSLNNRVQHAALEELGSEVDALVAWAAISLKGMPHRCQRFCMQAILFWLGQKADTKRQAELSRREMDADALRITCNVANQLLDFAVNNPSANGRRKRSASGEMKAEEPIELHRLLVNNMDCWPIFADDSAIEWVFRALINSLGLASHHGHNDGMHQPAARLISSAELYESERLVSILASAVTANVEANAHHLRESSRPYAIEDVLPERCAAAWAAIFDGSFGGGEGGEMAVDGPPSSQEFATAKATLALVSSLPQGCLPNRPWLQIFSAVLRLESALLVTAKCASRDASRELAGDALDALVSTRRALDTLLRSANEQEQGSLDLSGTLRWLVFSADGLLGSVSAGRLCDLCVFTSKCVRRIASTGALDGSLGAMITDVAQGLQRILPSLEGDTERERKPSDFVPRSLQGKLRSEQHLTAKLARACNHLLCLQELCEAAVGAKLVPASDWSMSQIRELAHRAKNSLEGHEKGSGTEEEALVAWASAASGSIELLDVRRRNMAARTSKRAHAAVGVSAARLAIWCGKLLAEKRWPRRFPRVSQRIARTFGASCALFATKESGFSREPRFSAVVHAHCQAAFVAMLEAWLNEGQGRTESLQQWRNYVQAMSTGAAGACFSSMCSLAIDEGVSVQCRRSALLLAEEVLTSHPSGRNRRHLAPLGEEFVRTSRKIARSCLKGVDGSLSELVSEALEACTKLASRKVSHPFKLSHVSSMAGDACIALRDCLSLPDASRSASVFSAACGLALALQRHRPGYAQKVHCQVLALIRFGLCLLQKWDGQGGGEGRQRKCEKSLAGVMEEGSRRTDGHKGWFAAHALALVSCAMVEPISPAPGVAGEEALSRGTVEAMKPGIYALLDACGKREIESVHSQLGAGQGGVRRSALASLKEQHGRLHAFTGRV